MAKKPWSHVLLWCLILVLCGNGVLSDNNKYYHTSALCLHETEQALYKRVEGGAVVTSESERNVRCVVTFQTDSILQRFMLRFEHLALDCDDHLFVFDGAHEYGNYKYDLSCRSTRTEVGTIFTQGNYVTLKYITDNKSLPGNGFRLIVTAVKRPNTGCTTFRCLNDLCISKNLTCDGVNHCGDNSDETSQANCADETATKQILGLNFGTFVSLALGTFLICCVCVVAVIACVFRKEARQRQLDNTRSVVVGQYPTEPSFSSRLEEKPPPYPGSQAYPMQSHAPRGEVYYHAK
ncbi:hypothetical protein JTE90_007930 [Oedothorax gibbosus]|uniref:CUB domain-containing protein n=1 Tax=Oedothorax gibbosus TaxID=931172 RepID=A0AAV6VKH8_9ARAC|nr:hypothetical protein JTE90_007930 [Oedothorax gibbosus]